LLTLVLFNMVPRYGAYFSLMTGASLLVGNAIWTYVRNPLDLVLPMYYDGCRDGASDHTGCVMTLHYSWCFWLCLATGKFAARIHSNNNNNNSHGHVYGAVIMTKSLCEFARFI